MIKYLTLGIFVIFVTATSYSAPMKIALIKNTPDQKVAAKILTEIYTRFNVPVVFIELPGKRALIDSSKGLLDGEAQRIFEIGTLYPNLIRVPTSYITWGVSAFTTKQNFTIRGWASLKGHSVTMVRGMLYAEKRLHEAGIKNITLLGDIRQSMMFLAAGRTEFSITSQFNGIVQLKKLGITSIQPLSPQLEEIPLYHYLHVKHKSLIPAIDATIQSMEKSGELKALKNKLVLDMLQQSK